MGIKQTKIVDFSTVSEADAPSVIAKYKNEFLSSTYLDTYVQSSDFRYEYDSDARKTLEQYLSFLELIYRSGQEKDRIRFMTRRFNFQFRMEGNNLVHRTCTSKQVVSNVSIVLAALKMFLKISDFSEDEVRVLKLDRLINLVNSDFSEPVRHNFLAA